MIAEALAHLDYPMMIVTASSGGERSGCLAGFGTQCSIHPMRWLVCVSNKNHTHDIALHATGLAVHFLHDDQCDIARLFGHQTGDEVDKFARCAWRVGPYDAPVLEGCDWIAGTVIDRFALGDHTGHLLEISEGGHEHGDGPQLGFQQARSIEPGHEP